MHEQIFIAAVVVYILVLALRPWRRIEHWEPPPIWTPRPMTAGLGRKKKTPKEKYPVGFA